MIVTASRIRLMTGAALLAGMAVLSGCGSTPYSRTTTSEVTTTTTPAPMVNTTTTTTQEDTKRP